MTDEMCCDKFVFCLHSGNKRTELLKTQIKPRNILKTMQDVVAEDKNRKQDLIEHKIRTTSVDIIKLFSDTEKIYTICVWQTTRRKRLVNLNNKTIMLYIRSRTTAQCKHRAPRKKDIQLVILSMSSMGSKFKDVQFQTDTITR